VSRAVVLEDVDAETLSKLLGGTGNAPAPSHVEASRPGTIVKAQAAKRQLLLVAYPAMKADVGRAADGFRDFAGPDAVEKACHEFAKGGYQLGLWHEKGHEDCGTVLENYVFPSPTSWVVKGPSGDEMEICQGDWLVKVELKPYAWEMYEKGLIGGASPEGPCSRNLRPAPDVLAALRS
jgi:hypothetical protein